MKKLLAVAVLLAVASPAAAHDHRPPKTYLWNDGRSLQKGQLISWCWEKETHRHHSVGQCGDGVDRFEDLGAMVPADDEIAIRIGSRQRPRDIHLRTYPTEDASVATYQTGEDVPVRLVRKQDAWHIAFKLSRPCSHHYLRFSARWPDVETRASQDAYYTFHAVTTMSALGDMGAPLCTVLASL